jgi:FAD binding domain
LHKLNVFVSVKVGAGARWFDVYRTLEAEGLMVLGGRVADVGVGGLTLGGGISFYSNQYGWVCDSVISYEIVLPDGKIMEVTQKSAPDLFKALRGAGQTNFGVVTSFTYESFEPPNPSGMLWDTIRTYSWDKLDELTKLHLDYLQAETEMIQSTGGFFAFGYESSYDVWVIVDRYVHTTHPDSESWPKVFAPFKVVEPLQGAEFITVRPFSNISEEIKSQSPYGFRNAYATFTFKPSYTLMTSILSIFKEEIEKIKEGVDGFLPAIVWHLLSQQTITHMQKNGGSAISMNLRPEDAPLVIFNLAWRWHDTSDDEKIYGALDRFLKRAEGKAKEMKAWHPFKYINYAHVSQNPLEGFGEEGLEWLIKLQKEVDPKGIFTRVGLNRGAYDLHQETVFEQDQTNIRDEL